MKSMVERAVIVKKTSPQRASSGRVNNVVTLILEIGRPVYSAEANRYQMKLKTQGKQKI